MNKRQCKKLIKNAKRNFNPYREAMRGGSKKLDRRRKCLFRFASKGGASWDQTRQIQIKYGFKKIPPLGVIDPKTAFEKIVGALTAWSGLLQETKKEWDETDMAFRAMAEHAECTP